MSAAEREMIQGMALLCVAVVLAMLAAGLVWELGVAKPRQVLEAVRCAEQGHVWIEDYGCVESPTAVESQTGRGR